MNDHEYSEFSQLVDEILRVVVIEHPRVSELEDLTQ